MSDKHADERDRKRRKKRYGMQMSGRSIKTVLLPVILKRATCPKCHHWHDPKEDCPCNKMRRGQ